MEIKITYIAEDGTEFDNKEQCVAYEETCKAAMDGVVFLDAGMNVLNTMAEIDYFTEFFLIVNTKRADYLFDRLHNYCGFKRPKCVLHEGEVFLWDDSHDKWISCQQQIAQLEYKIKAVEKKALEVI